MQIKEQLPKDDLSISDEWVVGEEKINEAFGCPICYFVVKEPVQCRGCQTLFCEDCIDEWIANNSQACPYCRRAFEKQDMNRFLKD